MTTEPAPSPGAEGAPSPRAARADRRPDGRADRDATRRSLAAVGEIWASRRGARTRADLAYLVYLVLLTLAVLVAPALRAIALGLARPDVLPVLASVVAPQVTTAVMLLAAAGLVMLGATRGPALLAPFFTVTLASSALPRRTVLWRPFLRAALVPLGTVLTVAVLIGATLGAVGLTTWTGVLQFGIAAAGSGLLLVASWLLGQLLGRRSRQALAVALALAAAATTLLPISLGPGAAYPSIGTTPGAEPWAVGLLLVGLVAAGACIPLLDRVRGGVLLEQAARWESATTTATSGDLSTAAGVYRARPTVARRVPALGGGPLALIYARRDAIAWLRTPERTVIGVLAAAASAAAVGWAISTSGPLAWLLGAVGVLGFWLASGTFVDGIRHAVHTLGAPPLLGQRAGIQALLHALAPTLLLTVLGAIGGGAAAMMASVPATVLLRPGLIPVTLAPVMVALRVHAAAKGPMPLKLATPMPTPQGDVSVFPMLAWQADAILLALAAGGMIVLAALLGPLWMVGTVGVLMLGIVLLTRSRFRELIA